MGQFAIYKVNAVREFVRCNSAAVPRERPARSKLRGARVTNVWLTRYFSETYRLRGRVAVLVVDG